MNDTVPDLFNLDGNAKTILHSYYSFRFGIDSHLKVNLKNLNRSVIRCGIGMVTHSGSSVEHNHHLNHHDIKQIILDSLDVGILVVLNGTKANKYYYLPILWNDLNNVLYILQNIAE